MSVIYLYGDIGKNEDVGVDGFTLQDVISMVVKLGDFDNLTVRIKSRGGSVQVGYDIFNYLRSLGKPITTIADGEVASIATVVFLAGDVRLMSKDSYLIIHNPWAKPEGEADFLMEYAKSLKTTENDLISFYSKETGHTTEAIQPLMRDETKILAEQSVSLGFATGLETTIAAPLAFITETKIKNKMSDHLTKEEAEKKFGKIEGMFNTLMNKLSGKKSSVALVLQDANGSDVDFPDLAEGDEPKTGDKATVDGKPAEGEIVMPDGKTFKFEGGELKEIVDAEPAKEDETTTALKQANEQLKNENAQLKADNEKLTTKVSDISGTVNQLNTEFLNFKKSVGSSFNYKAEITNPNEEHQPGTTRSLFKK